MKKIAIVTIIDKNLGNRLQNYALQTYVEGMGYEVKTLVYKKFGITKEIKRIGKNLIAPFVSKYDDIVWENFNKKIKWDNRLVNEAGKSINETYDYFLAGSDQIWNPNFDFISEREFLTFADSKKRIAYAASIGVDKLPEEKCDEYKNYFNGFKAISVREKEASKIVFDLTGKDVPVVLDPTMLFDAERWGSIAKESRLHLNNKFVLMYFLGKCSNKKQHAIENLAKSNNCEVFNIMDSNGKVKKNIGPAEFLWLIQNSEYVGTDSFHGAVFSVLFHKRFFVFERPTEPGYGNMNSRIETLINRFDLKSRYVLDTLDDVDLQEYKDITFDDVDIILEKERIKARDFLSESMKG